MAAAFDDLEVRLGRTPGTWPDPSVGAIRVRHLLRTDPAGSIAAEAAGRLVGAALAIMRDGVWGLSLLVVHPAHQSAGLGRRLLAAALDYGAGMRGGIILASADARALRSYARAGFALHPAADARGVPQGVRRPDGVREGRWPADRALSEQVDRFVRGAAHGDDIGAMLAQGGGWLVHEGGGYAVYRSGAVRLLAATSEDVAAELLRAAIATAPPGEPATVEFITAQQDWAVPVLVEAGLRLGVKDAVFVKGDVGPFRPYLPSGSYL